MNGARAVLMIGLALCGVAAGGVAHDQSASTSSQTAQKAPAPRAKVANPHGPIAIPCQNCHTYTSWKPIRAMPEFNHDTTGYPLRGMHKGVACTQCHSSLVFHNVSKNCADCHADIHRGQMGANCQSCHSVQGWQVSLKAIRNHDNRFPLVGAHALVDCEGCHKGAAVGQFKGLSTACYSCHQQDFHTTVLDHVASGFPTTCESCHTMDSWFGAKFDHLKFTGFALLGAHATLPCTSCHINNQYKNTPADCYSCHTTDFAGASNPSHVQLGLPHDCGLCHSTVNWLNASFNHALYANYPLTGAHANLACTQCHINNQYAGTSTACYACHKADYSSTTNPNHVGAGFPTDCSICHSTTAWSPSSFNHSTTGFALTGAHTTLQCLQCHVNNNYSGSLPTDCYSCHKADYTGTTNPNHVSAGFPTTCDTCHTTTSWAGATFNHNNTPFPLTGAHVNVACTQCHINNVFAGTPTDCYSCHKADYSATTNPNHVSAGFPTTCATCHTTVSWLGATFNHTWFNTNHGGANGVCATCHTNSSDYSVFTCTNCHTKATTDSRHQGVSGYVYNSVNCYACHKSGGGG